MNKNERQERKDDARLRELRFGRFPRRFRNPNHISRYWSLEWQVRDRRAAAFTAKHGRPGHDALVERMHAHKQEVKSLRRSR